MCRCLKPAGLCLDARCRQLEEYGQVRHLMAEAAQFSQETREVHEQYVRTHGDYAPGEQKRRNYQWNGLDPEVHPFGVRGEVDAKTTQVGELMRMPEPGVISRVQADFALAHKDELGRPRTLGYGERPMPSDHAFGKPTRAALDGWGVDKLLKGDYSAEEQAPDADLGKSIRPGFRNVGPEDRIFGVPSVRLDINPPKQRSVADSHNYGNEPSTASLLFPAPGADRGLTDEVLTSGLPKQEIYDLVMVSSSTPGLALPSLAPKIPLLLAGRRCHPGRRSVRARVAGGSPGVGPVLDGLLPQCPPGHGALHACHSAAIAEALGLQSAAAVPLGIE